MKRIVTLLVAVILCLATVLPVSAADGKVTYSGNAGSFVFAPGSNHSLTDLFPNFKGVMPGDTLTQKITVKNDADKKVKVEVYIRALGAHANSVEFLSKLSLKVAKSEDNKMAYMFDAASDQTAQLTDWVCLGTLYSGGEVNLDVTLQVPVELDNNYQNKIGFLDWEFMIKEFPVDDDDPTPPPLTGDISLGLVGGIAAVSAVMFILLLWLRKKNKDKE